MSIGMSKPSPLPFHTFTLPKRKDTSAKPSRKRRRVRMEAIAGTSMYTTISRIFPDMMTAVFMISDNTNKKPKNNLSPFLAH